MSLTGHLPPCTMWARSGVDGVRAWPHPELRLSPRCPPRWPSTLPRNGLHLPFEKLQQEREGTSPRSALPGAASRSP